jgi:hypothetical protein
VRKRCFHRLMGRCRRPQPLLDGTEASAPGQQQDEPGAEYVSSRQRAGLGNPAEFELLVSAEHNVTAGHAQLDSSKRAQHNFWAATVSVPVIRL